MLELIYVRQKLELIYKHSEHYHIQICNHNHLEFACKCANQYIIIIGRRSIPSCRLTQLMEYESVTKKVVNFDYTLCIFIYGYRTR